MSSAPKGVVENLQRGSKILALREWMRARGVGIKKAKVLVDEHIERHLNLYPPKVWPANVLRAVAPPPWCCQSHTTEVLREWSPQKCWSLPIATVDGVKVCPPCADRLAELAPELLP